MGWNADLRRARANGKVAPTADLPTVPAAAFTVSGTKHMPSEIAGPADRGKTGHQITSQPSPAASTRNTAPQQWTSANVQPRCRADLVITGRPSHRMPVQRHGPRLRARNLHARRSRCPVANSESQVVPYHYPAISESSRRSSRRHRCCIAAPQCASPCPSQSCVEYSRTCKRQTRAYRKVGGCGTSGRSRRI